MLKTFWLFQKTPEGLSRYFHRMTGQTFSAYLGGRKVARAAELLRRTRKSVTEIAFECGFNNLANFNRQFLKYKGCTPSAHRKLFQKES